jgi:hypothetical protein
MNCPLFGVGQRARISWLIRAISLAGRGGRYALAFIPLFLLLMRLPSAEAIPGAVAHVPPGFGLFVFAIGSGVLFQSLMG